MPSANLLSTAEQYLFSSVEDMQLAGLSKKTRDRMIRLRALYLRWLDRPTLTERDIIEALRSRYDVSRTVAYEDLRAIKHCIGNITGCNVEFERWKFRNRLDQAWELALKDKNLRAMAALLSAHGKYMRLDHPDSDNAPDYSAITPPFLEITADASQLGFEPIADVDRLVRRLTAQYIRETAPAATDSLPSSSSSPSIALPCTDTSTASKS